MTKGAIGLCPGGYALTSTYQYQTSWTEALGPEER